MTKLIIQIPCYNEEAALGRTLADLPRHLDGIDVIEWLIVDDGSTDKTCEIAKKNGVDHIIKHAHNLGLASAFMSGIEACLQRGADIIINTDADNQYMASDIPKLLAPILEGSSQMCIGSRPVNEIETFSPMKKLLQRIGSWVVRVSSGTKVLDAPSGFRAITRDAAMRLNVFNDYTYTLETIIQAGLKNIPVSSVPISVNPDTRPSKLVKSIRDYVTKSMFTIVRIFMVYRPLRFFLILGSIPFSLGFVLGLRWLIYFAFFPEPGRSHLPSLILAAILLLIGFQTFVMGFIADLMSVNRLLMEDIQLRLRYRELAQRSREKSRAQN